MNSFENLSLSYLKEINQEVYDKFSKMDSKLIHNSLNKCIYNEELLNDIDSLTDKLVNKIVNIEQGAFILNELENLNIKMNK